MSHLMTDAALKGDTLPFEQAAVECSPYIELQHLSYPKCDESIPARSPKEGLHQHPIVISHMKSLYKKRKILTLVTTSP